MYPTDLRYTAEHEWVRMEKDGIAVVGVTHFAQDQLGDVVFLNLPSVGAEVEQSKRFGEIESVKTVSEIFSPVNGKIVEINQEAVENPELVNKDPYGKGWLIKVAVKNAAEVEKLMTAQQYEQSIVGKERSH